MTFRTKTNHVINRITLYGTGNTFSDLLAGPYVRDGIAVLIWWFTSDNLPENTISIRYRR